MAANFPLPSKASLVQQYVGKSLQEIPLPAAVVDIAAVKRNCLQMRKAASGMGFALRPRVDAHKVSQFISVFSPFL
jgi:D-serine deaminase-like pyridoxal phosphate-dependent protein